MYLLLLAGTTDKSSSASSNESDLGSGGFVPSASGRVTNVLVVSSSVRMLHRVHRHTSDLRPAVALHAVLVESSSSLKHGLVWASSSSYDSDGGTARVLDLLLGSGWESDSGDMLVLVMRHDSHVGSGGTGHATTVTWLLLDAAHNGSLRHGREGQGVSNAHWGLGSRVEVLSGVDSLSGNEQLVDLLVLVRVTELHTGERSATTGVVDDVLDNSLHGSLLLAKVEATELRSALTLVYVSLKDGTASLTLTTNNTTHGRLQFVDAARAIFHAKKSASRKYKAFRIIL